jgi:Amt family ammonium transporter
MQGGVIALAIGWLIGPRIGKYNAEGKIVKPIAPHHIPMVMLGTFILAFGWFGFNAGSSLAGTDGRIGIIATNTMLASASAAITAMITVWAITGKPDPSMMCNGMLAGLVAITAPCAFVTPWAAFFFVGGLAGIFVVFSVFFFDKLGIDDAVGANTVHGVNGLWGILALGLFADGTYGGGFNGVGATEYMGKAVVAGTSGGVTGLLYGDSKQFMAQCIAGLTCFTWCFVSTAVIFTIVGKVVGGNRVPPEVEIAGLDIPEMGAPGYPEFVDHITPEQVSAAEVADAKAALAT